MILLRLGIVFSVIIGCSNATKESEALQLNSLIKDIYTSAPIWLGKVIQNFVIDNDDVIKTQLRERSGNVSDICIDHITEMVISGMKITNENLWAVKMLDSYTKIEPGITGGTVHPVGHFDECVDQHHSQGQFVGQYCWIGFEDQISIPRDEQQYTTNMGFCLPSTCSEKDVDNLWSKWDFLWNSSYAKLFKRGPSVCRTKLSKTETLFPYIILAIIFTLFSIALTCTVIDIRTNGMYPIATAFSMIKNLRSIFGKSSRSESMELFHGFRIYGFSLTLMLHATFSFRVVRINYSFLHGYFNDKPTSLVTIETFLFMSGVLTAQSFWADKDKSIKTIPLKLLYRLFRIYPAFLMAVLCNVALVPYFGTGPFKDFMSQYATDDHGLPLYLLVGNFFLGRGRGMIPMWFVPMDIQFALLSFLLLYPLHYKPKIGYCLVGFLICVAMAINSLIAYHLNLDSSILENFRLGNLKYDYCVPYTRCTGWMIGIMLGTYISKNPNMRKLTKTESKYLMWFAYISLIIAEFWVVRFNLYDRTFDQLINTNITGENTPRLETVIYLPTHRLIWSLGLAAITYCYVYGKHNLFIKFLCLDLWKPISRLMYCMMLVHAPWIYFRLSIAKETGDYLEYDYLFRHYAMDVVVVIILSIILSILVEIPFSRLLIILIGSKGKGKEKTQ